MKNNYTRKIEMICPSCRRKMFEYDEKNKNSIITCVSCKNQFTKNDLLKSNQKSINNNLKKLGEEAMKDFAGDIRKIFKSNKYFKINL